MLALSLVCPAPVHANDGRPRIGLVLGGGGAKGAAHIGVIKVLEELGVPVDLVVGTSMGAIVGGLHASGLNARQLEQAVEQIDWADIFDDDPPRAERSLRRKQDDSQVLIRYRIGIRDGSARLPDGVVLGQKLGLVLRRLSAHVPEVTVFDDLHKPFRAVAADIETGEPVVLASGSLARAMHASMSVPGVFPPLELDGRLLVDGGIANNLPIDVARAMGAERLIVVNVETRPMRRDELTGAVSVVEQTLNLLLLRETRRQLATLEATDVLISPVLGNLGAADFERSGEAVRLGEAAARKLSSRLDELAAARPGRESPRPASPKPAVREVINAIHLDNQTPLDDAVLMAQLSVRPGDVLDRAQVERGVSRIYGLGYFETVDYFVEETSDGVDLHVVARERSIGLQSLRFGLTLESDFRGDGGFNFVTEHQALGMNALGGEWRSALAFGQDVFVTTEFYQPLDVEQRWFVRPAANYVQSDVGIFDDGDRVAEYRVELGKVGVDLGFAPASCCNVTAGVRFGAGDASVKTGSADFEGGSFQIGSVVLGASFDTLDDPRFPRTGASFGVQYTRDSKALGADDDAEQVKAEVVFAASSGAHTAVAMAELGADLGGPEVVQSLFSLGGLFHLSGLARDEISGSNKVLGSVAYYYEVSRLASLDFGVPLYLGGSFEIGGVYDRLSDVGGSDDIVAGAAFLGADTPLGPVYLGFGMAEGGHRSLYLFLGQTF